MLKKAAEGQTGYGNVRRKQEMFPLLLGLTGLHNSEVRVQKFAFRDFDAIFSPGLFKILSMLFVENNRKFG